MENPPTADFPAAAAEKLLDLLPYNDQAAPDNDQAREKLAVTYRCTVCGHVFQVPDGEEPVCPVCKASGDKLERIG